jgi:capsular polysaccharide biosynthesis protein
MSQQALDLRRSIRIIRRYRVLVGGVVALGILCGAGYVALDPPMRTADAVVVLPQAVTGAQGTEGAAAATENGTGTDTTPYMATQVLIADSTAVLNDALPNVTPAMSLDQLRAAVETSSPTAYTVSISAKGATAIDAETTANAVAASYISYIASPSSPLGSAPARLLQRAAVATGLSIPVAFIAFGLVGGVAGAFVGIVAALTLGRKDRRLRERDAIANSLGVPVLASLSVTRPRDAAGWTKLLADYRPGVVQEWRLRKALQQLGVPGDGEGSSIAVLSLASDSRALAVGPQLASFAAGLGLRTTLVVGPQQDSSVTATLHTACAALPSKAGLRTVTAGAIDGGKPVNGGSVGATVDPDADLTVVVAVLDGRAPRAHGVPRTTTTVLGVSAGAATAEQLARVAVSAAEDGRDIAGVVVANPEPDDATTGQIPQLGRPVRRRLPTRLNGKVTENRR